MFRRALIFFLILSSVPIASAQKKRLDTTTFVVLGDGLAAGMGDFGLHEVYQKNSFPAQVARQIGTAFPQPLLEPPGLGNIPGLPALPVRVPTLNQTTVRSQFPPSLFVFNLSVPGLRAEEALSRKPAPPLVQTSDTKQTLINLILGYPTLVLGGNTPRWSQAEYARAVAPTMVLVALGYDMAVEAATTGNLSVLADSGQFRTNLASILDKLKGTYASVILATIPDPFDTAYFLKISEATAYVGAPPDTLIGLYHLISPDELITLPALMRIGKQILANDVSALPAGSVVSAPVAQTVRERVQSYNSAISSLATERGATVLDLNGLIRSIHNAGQQVGADRLTGNFLGGFYSLNGLYPGATGNGIIANELLRVLNQAFQTSFPLVNLETLAPSDPAMRFRPAKKKSSEATQ